MVTGIARWWSDNFRWWDARHRLWNAVPTEFNQCLAHLFTLAVATIQDVAIVTVNLNYAPCQNMSFTVTLSDL